MTNVFPEEDVNTDYFTDNNATGVDGGSPFSFIKLNKGATLNRIKAWGKWWSINGVEVWMTDGSSFLAGKRVGNSNEFNFESGELITSINIQGGRLPFFIDAAADAYLLDYVWNIRHGNTRHGLGAIMFETNHGRKWKISPTILKKNYWPEVGSGICCGIFGAAGLGIHRLGFAMLRNIKRTILTNISYPNLAMTLVATNPEVVADESFSNGTDRDQTFRLSGSKTVTVTREWSVSATLSSSLNVEIRAQVPVVANGDVKTTWTVSGTSSYRSSSSTSETMTWDWPLVCPPKRSIHGEVTMYSDEISTDFEADIELHLENGKVYRYKGKGSYKGISARIGRIKVKDEGVYDGH